MTNRARHRLYLACFVCLAGFASMVGAMGLPTNAAAMDMPDKLLIAATTELYNNNQGKGNPVGALAPFQSVMLVDMDVEEDSAERPKWYLVRTWLGDKWLKADDRVMNGSFEKVDRTITSVYDVSLFNRPDWDAIIPYKISPQRLHATAKITYKPLYIETALEAANGGGIWYRIHTWLGEKWIADPMLLEDVEAEPVSYTMKLTGEEKAYPYPYIVEAEAQLIQPQVVRATATWETGYGPWSMRWYKVELPTGPRWISPSHPVIPDYREVSEKVTLPTETRYFPSPQLEPEGRNWLEPGTYEMFEISGEWRHIRLPQGGEAWVDPVRALLERPVGIVQTDERIALTKDTETFRYPLTGEIAHMKGFYKPQTVKAFEKWVSDDGTIWYHFHGYGLDEWAARL